jgi:phenylalanyl-tRNA synthetase beta chain
MVKGCSKIPVVTLYYNRLKSMINKNVEEIINVLPYIGLDIEEEGNDYVKVEYNPNRPDFSTDYGIIRALKGLLDIDIGIPKYEQGESNVSVIVDDSVNNVRPYIVSLLALDGKLDDDIIREIITMQEDLHNGLGRKRRKISIGIHDYGKIQGPFIYTLADPKTLFVPLDESKEYTLEYIINNHELGKKYKSIIGNYYPIIKDANNNIISFPPIINSELTRVNNNTKDLFIEITATDLKSAQDALSILAMTLFDANFKIKSVNIDYNNKIILTPMMNNNIIDVDILYINNLLGLDLSNEEIIKALRRSRLDGNIIDNKLRCIIPPYRFDIINAIDIVEEIGIGYGIYRLEPTYPLHIASGMRDKFLRFIDNSRDVMISLNTIEVMNFDIIDKDILDMLGLNYRYEVEHSKSKEHEILRPSLIPSLLKVLSVNIHEPYPQLLFEIGKVFNDEEEYRLVLAIASNDTNFTNIKSYLQAFLKRLINKDPITKATNIPFLKEGVSANIIIDNVLLGIIGEVRKDIIEKLKIRVNISLFEISLNKLYDLIK